MNFNKTTKLVQGKPFDNGLKAVLVKYKLEGDDSQIPKIQVSKYLTTFNFKFRSRILPAPAFDLHYVRISKTDCVSMSEYL